MIEKFLPKNNDEFNLISDQVPERGKNIIGIDDRGEKHYCYLSKIGDEWRSLFGGGLLINIVKWKYDE